MFLIFIAAWLLLLFLFVFVIWLRQRNYQHPASRCSQCRNVTQVYAYYFGNGMYLPCCVHCVSDNETPYYS